MIALKKIGQTSLLLVLIGFPLLAQSINYPSILPIRKLFLAKDFDQLTARLENLQNRYEQDISQETAFSLVFRGLVDPDPAYEELYKLWIEQKPKSLLPIFARSQYYLQMGWHSRGGSFAYKTSAEQFRKLRFYHSKALVDINQAILMKPDLALLYATKINIAKGLSDSTLKQQALSTGLKVNPASYQLIKNQLLSLLPRWGGSYEQIAALLAEIKQYEQQNPKLKPLAGFLDYTKGMRASGRGQYQECIKFLTKALEYGEKDAFFEQRGWCYYDLKDYDNAVADFTRALEFYPEYVSALSQRSWAYKKKNMNAEALGDLDLAIELEPFNARLYKYRGYRLSDFNLYDEAIADFNTSVKINANDDQAWSSLAWNASFKLKDYQTAVKAYKKAIALAPDNVEYLHNYALTLNNMRDCGMKPVLQQYLQLCSRKQCPAKDIKWAKDLGKFLDNSGTCPK